MFDQLKVKTILGKSREQDRKPLKLKQLTLFDIRYLSLNINYGDVKNSQRKNLLNYKQFFVLNNTSESHSNLNSENVIAVLEWIVTQQLQLRP